ncbi:YnbE family lipoprotein [Parasphingorhabdus sp.]|uniref:YnbE family lipoprotein n=1 Tax=Parasphingorhabdus sp. TaxID=2709688 RepID=UPI003D2924C5
MTDRIDNAIRSNMRILATSGLMVGAMIGMTGCVQLTAPDKPIVINLNINIKQEVVYRLDGDAKDLINEEADIF